MGNFIKKHMIAVTVFVFVLMAGLGAYVYKNQGETGKEMPLKQAEVVRGDLDSSVSATGSLMATDNVDISSKITGRIVKVYVKENQHVNAGQLLLSLDDSSLKAVELQRKAALDDATLTLTRNKDLLAKGAVSAQNYDTALMNWKIAQAAYAQAASNTADTNIYSPIDGYVIGKPIPVGQTISSGISSPQVIMSIANLAKMQIEALVDESDIGKVKEGQKVVFTVDAYPDETFTGTVRLVSRSATIANNVVYYTVYVDVDESKNKLFPRMTAQVEIIYKSEKDKLIVPKSAVQKSEEKDKKGFVVEKVTGNGEDMQTEKVSVKTGSENEGKTVIYSDGVKAGDKVILRPARARQNGGYRGRF